MRLKLFSFPIALAFLAIVFCVPQARAQVGTTGGDQMVKMSQGTSSAVIHVVDSAGKPIEAKAEMKLTNPLMVANSRINSTPANLEGSARHGVGRIEGITPGEYVLEVSAPGYLSSRQNITVHNPDEKTEAIVKLITDDGSSDSDLKLEQPNVPQLPAPLRKELEAVVPAVDANKMSDADHHVKDLLKRAPDNPDVHFVAGYYAEHTQNDAEARTEYEAAIKLSPTHFSAQLYLGKLLLANGDGAAAMLHAEAALAADPKSWRAHWVLAEAHLQSDGDAKQAKLLAQQAIDLGKESAARAQVTLAVADIMTGDRKTARTLLESFLKDNPDNPDAPRAKKILAQLQ